MAGMTRRLGLVGALTACTGALAVVVVASTSLASARDAGRVGGSAAGAAAPVVTPFVHAQPSGAKPYPGPSGTASPWTPLATAPPFSPGTMLLASDGTVLVHNEPSWGAQPSGGG